jgi:hydroxyquinol 1,2-dioxygenase
MNSSNENELTQAALARISDAANPRFAQVMRSLITHMHAFIREADITPEEWMAGIDFLTSTGQSCNDKRQEFILLSDTLGISMMVVILNQLRMTGRNTKHITHAATAATEATVQGPFYWEGAPDLPCGADITAGAKGEPTFYSGHVTDVQGRPIPGAVLDIWSGDGEGNYDMQIKDSEMAARARIRTDAEGRYWFWSIKPTYYPIPMDGPVGKMLTHLGCHPNRPGHIHMKVCAPEHAALTTHLFVANGPYLESDPVFGVRQSLIVDFQSHQPGIAPDGRKLAVPYWSAKYDFRLNALIDKA